MIFSLNRIPLMVFLPISRRICLSYDTQTFVEEMLEPLQIERAISIKNATEILPKMLGN